MQGAKGRSVGRLSFSRAVSGGPALYLHFGRLYGRQVAILCNHLSLFKASTLQVSRAGYIRLQSVPSKAPGGGNICIVMKLR